MRIGDIVITATLVAGVSGTAVAQPGTQNTGPETRDHWFASAYLGSNFGGPSATLPNIVNLNSNDVDTGSSASINFGGEVGYAWGGAIGAEFMVNHAPNFEIGNVLLVRRPSVTSYMFNGLAAIPIRGGYTRFRPFVSGGIGSVQLRSTIFVLDPQSAAPIDTTESNGSRFGWDLGGGVMGFNGAWGLRGDVRYFKATSQDNPVEFFQQELSGLSFWNANFGVAFRW